MFQRKREQGKWPTYIIPQWLLRAQLLEASFDYKTGMKIIYFGLKHVYRVKIWGISDAQKPTAYWLETLLFPGQFSHETRYSRPNESVRRKLERFQKRSDSIIKYTNLIVSIIKYTNLIGSIIKYTNTLIWLAQSSNTRIWLAPSSNTRIWLAPSSNTRIWLAQSSNTRTWSAQSSNTQTWIGWSLVNNHCARYKSLKSQSFLYNYFIFTNTT